MRKTFRHQTIALALPLLLAAAACRLPAAEPLIWIEGEAPSVQPEGGAEKLGYQLGKMPNPRLSGNTFLMFAADEKKAQEIIPDAGLVFAYDFEAAKAGTYNVWARLGYERARSAFEWRIGAGPWTRIDGNNCGVDLLMLGRFFETSWVNMGAAALKPGKHRIEFKLLKPVEVNAKGESKPDRLLFSLDAIHLATGEFVPNFGLKPGEAYQSDADKAAAAQVYKLAAAAGTRSAVELTGDWEVAAWTEAAVDEATRKAPPEKLPDLGRLHWYGFKAPGDLRSQKPEFAYMHRVLYRTRVEVPAELKGGSFHLDFQRLNVIAGVFVNGQYCGGASDKFNSVWTCDVTKAVKPGGVNEVVLAVKDAFYGLDPKVDSAIKDHPAGARALFNLPDDFVFAHQSGGHYLDMPLSFGKGDQSGPLEPVTFVATGPVYAEDVFAMPSVKNKTLGLEIMLRNSGPAAVVSVENEIVPWSKENPAGAPSEKAFAAKSVSLAAGAEQTVTLSEAWANPKLWWPDDPKLYTVITRVKKDGKVVDTKTARFGFREWGWDKPYFTLNGARWHFFGGVRYGSSPAEFLKICRETGQNVFRFWNHEGWGGMTKRQILEFMDENGIAVRDSMPLDGQVANYGAGLTETPEGGERTYRKALFDSAFRQGRAHARSWRNHPSVLIWSLENEVTYINAQNLGQGPFVEPALRMMAEEVKKVDPTRPSMVDGGNALRPPEEWKGVGDDVRALGPMPVNGGHYMETGVGGMALRDYPDAAYSNELWTKNKQRDAWFTLGDRPMFHGEIFFGNGYSPEKMAQLGGEEALQGRAQTAAARAFFMRMMSEGYRWADSSAAHHYWDELYEAQGVRNAWAPVTVLCREWNWTFGSGEKVKRTLKVENQTSRSEPLEVAWKLEAGGKTLSEGKRPFPLAPGAASDPFSVEIALPEVKERTSAAWTLTASRGGAEIYRMAHKVAILPEAPKPRFKKGELAVFDPKGEAKARLRALGVPFAEAATVDDLLASPAKVLLAGRDAVPEERAADPAWLRAVAGGRRLVALEQEHPLRFQAVAGDFDVTQYRGRLAFPEDLTHPAFAGLAPEDFLCWSGDHACYKGAYSKATRGARSLLQCDEKLGFTAFAESRLGPGLMVLNQTLTGEKLGTDAAARVLFDNTLAHAAEYQPSAKETVLVLGPDDPLGQQLAKIGVKSERAPDPVAAISGKAGIAVVAASPDNLAKLAAARDKVRAFAEKGGWLMLAGLEPSGLAAFNGLVGVEHLIRPFTLEASGVAIPRDPLAAGLGLRDLVMTSAEKVAPWMGLLWMADDVFSFVVDADDDIAPYCKLNGEGPKAQAARNPEVRNVVNGFTTQEFWKYIHYFDMKSGNKPVLVLELPRPETVKGFEIVLNTSYRMPRKLRVTREGEAAPVELACQADGSFQKFDLPPLKTAKVTVDLADFTDDQQDITGIDNFRLFIERDAGLRAKARPLTRPGGIVRYPMGKGGVLLNNLRIQPNDPSPANAAKKANITKVLFENLGAEFAGAGAVVAGAGNIEVTPVKPKDEQFNAFTNHRGDPPWFRDSKNKEADLATMPLGVQKLGGVTYWINDFSTSPVPTVIMLAGDGTKVAAKEVRGIAVGRKAGALFFLHTFHAGPNAARYNPKNRRENDPDPVVLRYRVNYADGKSEEAPVFWGEGVAHWLQAKPLALKSASVAWSAPVPGAQDAFLTLYSMQWNNPHPDAEIASIDVLQGTAKDIARWGAPAVIAISTASAK